MIRRQLEKITGSIERMRLKNKKFTIFCNNCLASFIYQKYNLQYLTPTISINIKPCDFIKFCKNYKHYLSLEVEQTKICDKEWYASIGGGNNINFPLGKIDDITLYFQHATSFEQAKQDWDRRKTRIVEDNIFIILFDMIPDIKTAQEFENIEHFPKLYLYHKGDEINTKSAFKIQKLENTSRAWWGKMNRLNPFSKKYFEQFDFTKWFNQNFN